MKNTQLKKSLFTLMLISGLLRYMGAGVAGIGFAILFGL